jgi:hypothetical protein
MFKRIALSLLSACAVTLAVAGSASANEVRIVGKPMTKAQEALVSSCLPGEFCAWRHASMAGGLYHYSGSDRNLWNDYFENHDTRTLVAGEISSVYNNGYNTANGDDVLAHGINGINWCIPNHFTGTHIYAMNDQIDGYYWTNCDGK